MVKFTHRYCLFKSSKWCLSYIFMFYLAFVSMHESYWILLVCVIICVLLFKKKHFFFISLAFLDVWLGDCLVFVMNNVSLCISCWSGICYVHQDNFQINRYTCLWVFNAGIKSTILLTQLYAWLIYSQNFVCYIYIVYIIS